MRAFWRLALLAALALAIWPEVLRHLAEHRLRRATDDFRVVLARPGPPPEIRAALDRVVDLALSAVPGLPGDPRARTLAGSARLVAGRPQEALELYREANGSGERAEIDLNIGRTYALEGDEADARKALLRALWISPALAPSLPEQASRPLLAEVARLEAEQKAGRLDAPPRMP